MNKVLTKCNVSYVAKRTVSTILIWLFHITISSLLVTLFSYIGITGSLPTLIIYGISLYVAKKHSNYNSKSIVTKYIIKISKIIIENYERKLGFTSLAGKTSLLNYIKVYTETNNDIYKETESIVTLTYNALYNGVLYKLNSLKNRKNASHSEAYYLYKIAEKCLEQQLDNKSITEEQKENTLSSFSEYSEPAFEAESSENESQKAALPFVLSSDGIKTEAVEQTSSHINLDDGKQTMLAEDISLCHKCGRALIKGSDFCSYCGSRVNNIPLKRQSTSPKKHNFFISIKRRFKIIATKVKTQSNIKSILSWSAKLLLCLLLSTLPAIIFTLGFWWSIFETHEVSTILFNMLQDQETIAFISLFVFAFFISMTCYIFKEKLNLKGYIIIISSVFSIIIAIVSNDYVCKCFHLITGINAAYFEKLYILSAFFCSCAYLFSVLMHTFVKTILRQIHSNK